MAMRMRHFPWRDSYDTINPRPSIGAICGKMLTFARSSHLAMKFAIIAAGEGSRLQQEGVALPKPLVRVRGEAMIDRLIRIFRANGAEEIVVIINRIHPQTAEHFADLRAAGQADDIRLVEQTTPSSMHSFAQLAPYLEGSPFCLTTVDTIFREDEFAAYIRQFQQGVAQGSTTPLDGCMAVTDYIDDEKPLYVGTDARLRITGFHDTCQAGDRFISGGIYALRPVVLRTLARCMAEGRSRMRNFQRALIEDGMRLQACPFSKILDVDHADDIPKAEHFLATNS